MSCSYAKNRIRAEIMFPTLECVITTLALSYDKKKKKKHQESVFRDITTLYHAITRKRRKMCLKGLWKER